MPACSSESIQIEALISLFYFEGSAEDGARYYDKPELAHGSTLLMALQECITAQPSDQEGAAH